MKANREQKDYLDKIEQRLFEKYGNERHTDKIYSREILPDRHEPEKPEVAISKA